MLKYLLVVMFIIFSSSLKSQEISVTPDYKTIETETGRKDSKFYYPALMDRYMKNDTTLSQEDFHYLYYGYSFRPAYSPYFHHDSLRAFFNYLNKESLSDKEYEHIIGLGNKILETDPFNLRVMNVVAYLYHEQGNDSLARLIGKKNASVIRAILSTGDGHTDSTAFYVITTSNEYDIINFHQLNFVRQALVRNKSGQALDDMTIEDKNGKKGNMYFNVTRLFEVERKMMKK